MTQESLDTFIWIVVFSGILLTMAPWAK